MSSPNPAMQQLVQAGFTADQLRALAAQVEQIVSAQPELVQVLSGIRDRLRQNGLIGDLAAHFSKQIAYVWESAGLDLGHELITTHLNAIAGGGPVSQSEAWKLASVIDQVLEEQRGAAAAAVRAATAEPAQPENVIDGSLAVSG